MMDLHAKAVWCLLIGCIIGTVLCKQLEDDWIDPLDPLTYDPAKTEKNYEKYSRIKNQEDHATKPVDNNDEHNRVEVATGVLCQQNPLNQCEKELLEIEKLNQLISRQPACEAKFFNQFVATLVHELKRVHEDMTLEESHFEIDISITEHGMKTLERFAQNSDNVNVIDVHSVLKGMLKGFRQVDIHKNYHIDWTWWISSIFQVTAAMAFLVIFVTLYWQSGIPLTKFMGSMLVIAFLLSIPWNWYSLYQKEVATRIAKSHRKAPPECTPEQLPFWRSLLSGFTLGDPCREYYENLHVDPWGEVPPTKAIAVTLTKFILEPLEHIGEAVGKMLEACVKDLPVQLWPVSLGLIIIGFLMTLIMCFGYKINLFYLLGMEPSNNPSLTANEKKLMKKLEDMSRELDELPSIIRDAVTQTGHPSLRNGENSQNKAVPDQIQAECVYNKSSKQVAGLRNKSHALGVDSEKQVLNQSVQVDDVSSAINTIFAAEHSRSVNASSDEHVKPANGRHIKKKQPARSLSDSSVAAQCGHTREEDNSALHRSDKGPIQAFKAAPGFDPLAKDTNLASITPSYDVEDVGSQDRHRSSLRPSESSDDSDLEIIEEEPENTQP